MRNPNGDKRKSQGEEVGSRRGVEVERLVRRRSIEGVCKGNIDDGLAGGGGRRVGLMGK